MLAYALLAALFTLVFLVALPGPDGLGAPFIASTCRFGDGMPFGGTSVPGECHSSLPALVADAVVVTLVFLAIDRIAGRTAGTATAVGSLLVAVALAYAIAGHTTDRLPAWIGCLAAAAILGSAYAQRVGRLRRPGRMI